MTRIPSPRVAEYRQLSPGVRNRGTTFASSQVSSPAQNTHTEHRNFADSQGELYCTCIYINQHVGKTKIPKLEHSGLRATIVLRAKD